MAPSLPQRPPSAPPRRHPVPPHSGKLLPAQPLRQHPQPTGGSEPARSPAAPSASAGPTSLRPASPSATTAPAPTAPTSGSEPARSPAGPSVHGGLSETSEAGNRGAPSISSGAVSGESGGKVPDQAVQIVTEFEGFVDHVYDDGVGVATIGYGTTRYPDGRRVRFGDPNITKATAKIIIPRSRNNRGSA